MLKKIDRLLWKQMNWKPIIESVNEFVSDRYPKEECYLRMNNFPEEPLWTLFYKNDSIDFDDTPILWKVTYREDTSVSEDTR